MAPRVFSVTLLLAVACCAGRAVAAGCDQNPAAKFRVQVGWKLTPLGQKSTAAITRDMDAWLAPCAAVAYGQGPGIAPVPATFGMVAAPPGAVFADYGMWSDWASLEDIAACYDAGMKAGTIQALKKYYSDVFRIVLPLAGGGNPKATCAGAPGSPAPAGARFMFWYLLKDTTPAVCKAASTLHEAIIGTSNYVRNADGCDAAPEGPNSVLPNTADFAGSTDFRTAADVTAYLSNGKAAADRAAIRKLNRASMRMIIALSPTPSKGTGKISAATASKAGAATGGR